LITLPAAPKPSLPWRSIRRVEATLRDKRNNVATRRMDGKTEKSKGFNTYMETNSMVKERVILIERRKSRIMGRRGIIMIRSIPTTPMAITVSLPLKRLLKSLVLT
jgi:hypothetical protein